MKPQIFVGSSGKSLKIAQRVVKLLNRTGNVEARPWPTFFKPGTSFVKSLEEAQRCQFGVFLFARDDSVISKGKQSDAPRDNVVFEAGMLAGVRGFERLFILLEERTKLLSDLSGFNVVRFRRNPRDKSVLLGLEQACASIHAQVIGAWQERRVPPEKLELIEELLECSSRAATLGTPLGVDDLRAFCHLHDGAGFLRPLASFMGNRRDPDKEMQIICDPGQPKSDWYIISEAYLTKRFTVKNVNWTRARRDQIPGAKDVVPNLGAIAAQPIVVRDEPCGTVCFDSKRKLSEIGWNTDDKKQALQAILKTVAEIIARLVC
jgi:hypothetical protein